MGAPAELIELVARFESNRDQYLSRGYKETPVRRDFIDPLFKQLGWDVANEAGASEAYRDVVHEDTIRIEGKPKAPDYSFRIGGERLFLVEAKRPADDLAREREPAYQLRRYAWTLKLPVSILTDFQEFAIYDCRVEPAPGDGPDVARDRYYRYTDYVAIGTTLRRFSQRTRCGTGRSPT